MKIILHADMNSYFASVEQQANPFLRGKPVAICSRLSPYACIIACSIEAKKLGIKTGFNINEAKKLAPNIIALEVDPPKIKTVTDRVFAIFADYTSTIEAYSIDEAFLDLTGFVTDFNKAKELALLIKKRIKEEVGDWLRCSIGISHTRWLAKFAGELQKPDGLTVLEKRDLLLVYAGRPVDEAWGIANGWKTRLAQIGIFTLSDLLLFDPLELKRIYGISAYLLWANISGKDIELVKPSTNTSPKSIGHSFVLNKRTNDPNEVSSIIMKLCERVGRRLRAQNLEARRIVIAWGSESGSGFKSVRCPDLIFDSYDIFNYLWQAFYNTWDRSKINYLAVTSSGLLPSPNQRSFFTDREDRKKIATALDAVNDRYGEYTIIRGRMYHMEKNAPVRIGFRQTINPTWRGELVKTENLDY